MNGSKKWVWSSNTFVKFKLNWLQKHWDEWFSFLTATDDINLYPRFAVMVERGKINYADESFR
ncbi:MAG: hypothetical protein PUP91_32020 [Rhizonema sp. PD37]|nr:hypothetical protein [Rhizonema sp. PD37]